MQINLKITYYLGVSINQFQLVLHKNSFYWRVIKHFKCTIKSCDVAHVHCLLGGIHSTL